MNFGIYNAKDCVIEIGGVHITGLAEDFWSFEKREALSEESVGAQGDVVSSIKNDPIWDATVTVQATSPQANYLLGLMKATKPFPIWCTNKSLGRKEGGTMAIMSEAPSDELGAAVGDLEFKFSVLDGDIITD